MRTYWLNGVTNSGEDTLNQEVKVNKNSLNSSKISFVKIQTINLKFSLKIFNVGNSLYSCRLKYLVWVLFS